MSLPRPPFICVGAGLAVEDVGVGIADQGVGEDVAGAVDRGGAGQGEVLESEAEGVGDRALHRVGALAEELVDGVAGIVDDIGVVAEAAAHEVGAEAAVEDIVADVAGEGVGVVIAGAVDRGDAGEVEILDIGAEREADRAPDDVDAARRAGLDHHVADIVDDIGIAAVAAGHGVGAGAAVEHVDLAVAGQAVVEIGADDVLDVEQQVLVAKAVVGRQAGAKVDDDRAGRQRYSRRCRHCRPPPSR